MYRSPESRKKLSEPCKDEWESPGPLSISCTSYSIWLLLRTYTNYSYKRQGFMKYCYFRCLKFCKSKSFLGACVIFSSHMDLRQMAKNSTFLHFPFHIWLLKLTSPRKDKVSWSTAISIGKDISHFVSLKVFLETKGQKISKFVSISCTSYSVWLLLRTYTRYSFQQKARFHEVGLIEI